MARRLLEAPGRRVGGQFHRLDGPLDWTRLSLTMRQTLTATAGDVGSAHIDATLITLHIPTPATLALLPGLLLLRRSRT